MASNLQDDIATLIAETFALYEMDMDANFYFGHTSQYKFCQSAAEKILKHLGSKNLHQTNNDETTQTDEG